MRETHWGGFVCHDDLGSRSRTCPRRKECLGESFRFLLFSSSSSRDFKMVPIMLSPHQLYSPRPLRHIILPGTVFQSSVYAVQLILLTLYSHSQAFITIIKLIAIFTYTQETARNDTLIDCILVSSSRSFEYLTSRAPIVPSLPYAIPYDLTGLDSTLR